MDIPKITTFLMFNDEAEEAIQLYTSLFEDSEIITMVKYGEEGPAMSLYVTVKDTMEMERLFNGLKSEGAILMPKTEMPPFREFAWVQDKFGVSFQLALPENK
ncbi:MAG: VOC family protein [Staphylococcus epidermidis]|nr:VOC family protein [Staphylococcus epidermidis]